MHYHGLKITMINQPSTGALEMDIQNMLVSELLNHTILPYRKPRPVSQSYPILYAHSEDALFLKIVMDGDILDKKSFGFPKSCICAKEINPPLYIVSFPTQNHPSLLF